MIVNPITLEVVCESLIAIVREMRATIIRASYSSVIYEFDDFSCALFGPGGEMVAQSWDHPGHVLPLPWGVRCALEDFAGDLHPGDAILLNDPYRGGTHMNDVTLLCPVFGTDGEMLIFPAVRAHWVDVGGMVPGSYSGLSTNIFQEGVRIPPIKIHERGAVNRAAMTLLMANMRVPEEREGDLNASLGACRVAERRIRALIAKYGWDVVKECVRLNLDRTERRLRGRIASLPDGDYFAEDYLEFYNQGRLDPVLARLKLTVAGDQLIADFDGTNPQVPGVVNCSLAVAGAGVFVAVKATLDPGGAVNDGAFRPLTLMAPEASIFNCRSDAPAGAHGEVRKRGVSLAMAALSQIIPDRVSGDLSGSSFPNSIGGWNERRNRQYVYYESPAGGNGGFAGADGPSAFVNIDFGNLPSVHNVESIETEMPLLVESCTLRP
ncbi:MAG TPA: hydantoinase B/oxoprolinase family protein, partial [Rhodopila sp.]|uniref:hydantoinase B/oxoprolinase family protein n=1 Tax=Rhodopila sp. TaxID=2480087 RepID=UPI002C7C118E